MKPRMSMVTLGTGDLARATAFYQDGLGFPKMDFEGDITFFELQGTWLALYAWEALAEDATVPSNGVGFRGVTLAHNVMSEDEVVAVLNQAEQAGARMIKPAQKTDWGGFSGYFEDLDQHLWEVAYAPSFMPGPKDPSETHGL